MNKYVSWCKRGVVHLITVDNPPINALSQQVRKGLIRAVEAGTADDEIEILAVFCRGRTFCAGADIGELNNGLEDPGLLELIDLSENTEKPVLAALHGHVYGGGVIVALAADYRIAAPTTKFAMPEVSLGLLPTFGGTQYLPRLMGMQVAAEMIVDGRVIEVQEACSRGLVDSITESSNMEAEALAYARVLLDSKAGKRPVRDQDKHLVEPENSLRLLSERHQFLDSQALEFSAREACIELLKNVFSVPLKQALKREHAMFLKLLASENSAILRRQFFEKHQRI